MNNKPSLESQFLVTLLAFTSLLYGNVWLLTRAPAAAPQAEQVEAPAISDFSARSREETAAYLISEVTRQLSQAKPYLAAAVSAAGGKSSAAIPQSSLSPTSSPLPFSRCQVPQELLRPGGALILDFTGPSAGAYRPPVTGEYHAPLLGSAGFSTVSLGSGLDPRRGTIAFPGTGVSHMKASGELIAYDEYDSRIGRAVLRVRTAGVNRLFEPQGGDDQIVDIFTAVPGSIVLQGEFDIQRDRLVFLIREVATRVEHLIEVRFPNGVGGGFVVAVPSASTAMSSIPPDYNIHNVEIGTNGAIAFKLLDNSPRLPQPQPPPWEHMARVMSAGLNGQWEYTQPSDDSEYVLNPGGGVSTERISLSQGNEFVAHAQTVTGFPSYGVSIVVYYFGPDAVPQTGDGEYVVNIPEGTNGEIHKFEIEGFLPASGSTRPSASRLLYVMDDRYSQSPTFTEVLKFRETGLDNRYGTGDDVVREQRPVSNAMANISNIGLADRFRVWSEATVGPSSIVYGAEGCW